MGIEPTPAGRFFSAKIVWVYQGRPFRKDSLLGIFWFVLMTLSYPYTCVNLLMPLIFLLLISGRQLRVKVKKTLMLMRYSHDGWVLGICLNRRHKVLW